MNFVFAGYRVATTGPGFVSMSECVVDVVSADEFGWEPFFSDRVPAEQACGDTGRLLAVGFHREDAPDQWRAAGLMPEGDVLGYELVGWDAGWGVWHTWRCLDLVGDVGDATGVGPGEHGLIQDVEQARSAARWLTASGLGDPKVFLWVAALLVRP